jgi:hypothetical protein
VLIKLMMNVGAIAVLLLYVQTLASLANLARMNADPAVLRDPSPTAHGAAAAMLLLVATILSIYKPRGVTPYGQRAPPGSTASP